VSRFVASATGVPSGMVAAVYVDALVDGLLIGIAYFINSRAGLIMTLATAVEAGFLGLSFSASLSHVGHA
jgi:ZIP family zinc transporter